MTAFDFFRICVAVAVVAIAARAFWRPTKLTLPDQQENWQPKDSQDVMIVNDAVTSHDSASGTDA
jgi:hypothetical protein